MMHTKKLAALALAVTSLAAFSLNANAAEASTQFTFELKNDPTYTVTIPAEVTLTKTGTEVSITAENVANLEDNQKISVTIAGTDAYRNQMVLSGKTDSGSNASVRYQFVKKDGTVIETTGEKDQVNGVEIASFTDNGTETLTVLPILNGSSSIKYDVIYTGSMTYGIELITANSAE